MILNCCLEITNCANIKRQQILKKKKKKKGTVLVQSSANHLCVPGVDEISLSEATLQTQKRLNYNYGYLRLFPFGAL